MAITSLNAEKLGDLLFPGVMAAIRSRIDAKVRAEACKIAEEVFAEVAGKIQGDIASMYSIDKDQVILRLNIQYGPEE